MKNTILKSFILICFLSFLFPTMIAAKDQEITHDLREKKTQHQFIISGDDDDFEVTMVLPDGTKIDHEDFDAEKYMYFALENKRIWAIDKAPKGTYTFIVKSNQEDSFTVRTKDSIEKPELEWKKPSDETISVQADEEMELKWKATGDFESSYGNMTFMLQPKEGWHTFKIDSTSIDKESYDLRLPDSIPSGEYKLSVQVDDVFMEETDIDTDVIIDYDNPEFEVDDIEVVDQIVENGMLYLVIEVPKYTEFNRLEAEFYQEDEEEAFVATVDWEELDVYKELEDTEQFLWSVMDFDASGNYDGQMLAFVNNETFSEPIGLDQFQIERLDYDDDAIEWSIESGLTNASNLDVTVNVSEDTIVTIEDRGEVLTEKEVSEEGTVISAPLNEGHRVIEVKLADGDQNSRIFTRNFQVDHTPPRLEMIQPLASHDVLDTSFASGFVELESTLQVNGKEVDYDDETGYFKVDDFGSQLTIELTDQSGNTVDYSWSVHSNEETSTNWLWIILINGAIICCAIGIIIYLKKTKPS